MLCELETHLRRVLVAAKARERAKRAERALDNDSLKHLDDVRRHAIKPVGILRHLSSIARVRKGESMGQGERFEFCHVLLG